MHRFKVGLPHDLQCTFWKPFWQWNAWRQVSTRSWKPRVWKQTLRAPTLKTPRRKNVGTSGLKVLSHSSLASFTTCSVAAHSASHFRLPQSLNSVWNALDPAIKVSLRVASLEYYSPWIAMTVFQLADSFMRWEEAVKRIVKGCLAWMGWTALSHCPKAACLQEKLCLEICGSSFARIANVRKKLTAIQAHSCSG